MDGETKKARARAPPSLPFSREKNDEPHADSNKSDLLEICALENRYFLSNSRRQSQRLFATARNARALTRAELLRLAATTSRMLFWKG